MAFNCQFWALAQNLPEHLEGPQHRCHTVSTKITFINFNLEVCAFRVKIAIAKNGVSLSEGSKALYEKELQELMDQEDAMKETKYALEAELAILRGLVKEQRHNTKKKPAPPAATVEDEEEPPAKRQKQDGLDQYVLLPASEESDAMMN